MSPAGCPKMSATPCNRNADESFPVLRLKSREQKSPTPLLIQDKDVLQPSALPSYLFGHGIAPSPGEKGEDALRRHSRGRGDTGAWPTGFLVSPLGMRSTAIRCWHCAVRSIMAHFLRYLH